jgi:redox-sensitive bicupin YhaK (pirin superfamily)
MSGPLAHAKIVLRRSGERGYAEHGGWLKSFHTFSFAGYYDHKFQNFGSLRVLNEDRVAPRNGFGTHPHRDAEIFSYILSGELTHRDSMIKKGAEGEQGKDFYRMKRGDVQFTTGGTGKSYRTFRPIERELTEVQELLILSKMNPTSPCISFKSGHSHGSTVSSRSITL